MLDKLVVWVLTLKMRASDERGQDLIEYGLLTGGIAVALVASVALFSGSMKSWFGDMANWVSNSLTP